MDALGTRSQRTHERGGSRTAERRRRVQNVHLLKVQEVQTSHPDMTFSDAWELAKTESPTLFNQEGGIQSQ